MQVFLLYVANAVLRTQYLEGCPRIISDSESITFIHFVIMFFSRAFT